MKRLVVAAAMLGMVASTAAQAQPGAPWRAAPDLRPSWLPVGTPLLLATDASFSTKHARAGEPVRLLLAAPLTNAGQVIVPAGATAVGEVAEASPNGHFGVKGKLGIRLLYLITPNGQVQLTGETRREGASGTLLSFGTMATVSWLSFLIHGTSASLPSGALLAATLAEPLPFFRDGAAQVASRAPIAGGVELGAR